MQTSLVEYYCDPSHLELDRKYRAEERALQKFPLVYLFEKSYSVVKDIEFYETYLQQWKEAHEGEECTNEYEKFVQSLEQVIERDKKLRTSLYQCYASIALTSAGPILPRWVLAAGMIASLVSSWLLVKAYQYCGEIQSPENIQWLISSEKKPPTSPFVRQGSKNRVFDFDETANVGTNNALQMRIFVEDADAGPLKEASSPKKTTQRREPALPDLSGSEDESDDEESPGRVGSPKSPPVRAQLDARVDPSRAGLLAVAEDPKIQTAKKDLTTLMQELATISLGEAFEKQDHLKSLGASVGHLSPLEQLEYILSDRDRKENLKKILDRGVNNFFSLPDLVKQSYIKEMGAALMDNRAALTDEAWRNLSKYTTNQTLDITKVQTYVREKKWESLLRLLTQ